MFSDPLLIFRIVYIEIHYPYIIYLVISKYNAVERSCEAIRDRLTVLQNIYPIVVQ